jgi:hypothetical protein
VTQPLRHSAAIRRDERRRRRIRIAVRSVAGLLAVVIVFGLGLALGEALHDNPTPGGTQTLVRTLKPLPLSPAPVTVTVRKPRP